MRIRNPIHVYDRSGPLDKEKYQGLFDLPVTMEYEGWFEFGLPSCFEYLSLELGYNQKFRG